MGCSVAISSSAYRLGDALTSNVLVRVMASALTSNVLFESLAGADRMTNTCEDSVCKKANTCEDSAARRFNPCEDSVFVSWALAKFSL
jgi:hypothetical protein